MVYTAKLDIDRRNSRPRLRSVREKGRGRGIQMVMARSRAKIGVMINRSGEDVVGRMGSLMNNFTPSAMGCKSPKGPTMFGPFRACI